MVPEMQEVNVMCHYAMYGPYKDHYACFSCRKVFRYHSGGREHLCPQCRGPLVSMGLDFKAPQQKDIEQWKVLEILHEHGIHFHSCGCGGPGYRPTRLRELPEFLQSASS
jgi:hypothetical protein